MRLISTLTPCSTDWAVALALVPNLDVSEPNSGVIRKRSGRLSKAFRTTSVVMEPWFTTHHYHSRLAAFDALSAVKAHYLKVVAIPSNFV